MFLFMLAVLTNLAYEIGLWFEKIRAIAYLYGSLCEKFGKLLAPSAGWIFSFIHAGPRTNSRRSRASISQPKKKNIQKRFFIDLHELLIENFFFFFFFSFPINLFWFAVDALSVLFFYIFCKLAANRWKQTLK